MKSILVIIMSIFFCSVSQGQSNDELGLNTQLVIIKQLLYGHSDPKENYYKRILKSVRRSIKRDLKLKLAGKLDPDMTVNLLCYKEFSDQPNIKKFRCSIASNDPVGEFGQTMQGDVEVNKKTKSIKVTNIEPRIAG